MRVAIKLSESPPTVSNIVPGAGSAPRSTIAVGLT
jgi:hypothetical protein